MKVFDSKTGALVQSMEGPQEVEWLNWHNKGPVVLAGSTDGTCWMWAAKTGDCMQVFAGHEDSVTCGAFTSSGKLVVTGSMDASLRIWSPKTGQCKHTFSPRSGNGAEWHEAAILCLAVHPDPDKPLVLTGSIDGSARLVHAFHAWLTHTGSDVWFEYIPTKANPSDEPSRDPNLWDREFTPAPGAASDPRPISFPALSHVHDPHAWQMEAERAVARM